MPMGKSKKVKAERINAIRKQYDAFLEEDRKRKDRNEYIIDRLDKMSSCCAVLQKHSAPKAYGSTIFYPFSNEHKGGMERNSVIGRFENSCVNEVNNRNILTALNESTLLKEIHKNYILIPRYTNALKYESKNPIKLNADDNSDWKSKYSILEELKRNEKEEEKECFVSNSKQSNAMPSYPLSAQLDDIKTEHTNDNIKRNSTKPLLLQLNNESVKKISDSSNDDLVESNLDAQIDTVLLNTKVKKEVNDIGYNLNEVTNSREEISKINVDTFPLNVETEKAATSSITSSSDICAVKEQLKSNDDRDTICVEYKENKDINDLTEKEKIQVEYEIKLKPQGDVVHKVEDCTEFFKIDNENKIELESSAVSMQRKQVHSSNHETNPNYENSFLEEPPLDVKYKSIENTDFSSLKQQHSKEKECLEEIVDINNQVYDANNDINNQYTLQESSKIDINPADQNNTQQENVNTDENQIREFETEQNNMFYTEQTNLNYTYDQMNVNDTVQAEYTNNPDYIQDDNYGYYEVAPQGQTYVGGINEHEESNEQYDPHYEEQYGNYEPAIDPNTNIETEKNVVQQSYDPVQLEKPEYNSVQEVQQQLDNEEGYNESVEYPNASNVEPERRITEEEAIIT